MRVLIVLFIAVLSLFSCDNEKLHEDVDVKSEDLTLAECLETNAKTILKDIDSLFTSFQDSLIDTNHNYKDAKGLKQGKWVKSLNGKVVSIRHYSDNILNGYFFEWENMQTDGYYIDGLKEGYFRTYYGDSKRNKVMLLSFYENDSALWYAHPAADKNFLIPMKGIDVLNDSCYVIAPHYNGKLWYEGLFVKGFAKGKHKVYSTKEELTGIIDYDKKQILTLKSFNKRAFATVSQKWIIDSSALISN